MVARTRSGVIGYWRNRTPVASKNALASAAAVAPIPSSPAELLAAGRKAYSDLKNVCVWVKHNAGMGSFYRSQHEFVFVFKNGKGVHKNNVQLGRYGRHRSNIWFYRGANDFGRATDEGKLLSLHP